MQDLVTQTWENLGKPYHFTERQIFKMLHEACGQGEHPEVEMLHDGIHESMQLQSIDDLLQPYKQSQASSARIFDMHGSMPDIQDYQIPPQLQPQNAVEFYARKDEIAKHLRDRNYSNRDIFHKLDEMLLDLGGGQQQHTLGGPVLGSRWS